MTRKDVLSACINNGIISHYAGTYSIITTHTLSNRWNAAQELKQKGAGASIARASITRMIERVAVGLDPLKENRGGARAGAGLKVGQKVNRQKNKAVA